MRGLDVGRVLERAPRELGERLAIGRDALGLHLEAALLRHGRVPDVVRGEERGIERDVCRGREPVLGGIVRGHVDDGVDVGLAFHVSIVYDGSQKKMVDTYEGYPSEIPEDD